MSGCNPNDPALFLVLQEEDNDMKITTDGDGNVTFEVDSENEQAWVEQAIVPAVQRGDYTVIVR